MNIKCGAIGLRTAFPSLHRRRSGVQCAVDANNWLALHHSIDSMTFSHRAYLATKDLLRRTPDINVRTTGSQPTGSTPLHFACSGSDIGFHMLEVVIELLDQRADIEAKEANDNTPLLLAAGTGVTDVCDVLWRRGANMRAENVDGKGAWQKAGGSSPSCADWLLKHGAHKTYSTVSSRTRHSVGHSREARYAATTSWSSPYGRQSGPLFRGKGAKGTGRGSQPTSSSKGSQARSSRG